MIPRLASIHSYWGFREISYNQDAMKEISLDPPFARGRTADVYVWDDGHVLKLFHNWFDLEGIEYEQRIARAVHASGVRTPAVGDVVQVQGRNGLIYERVTGESMLTILGRKPWKVFAYARALAQLHLQMHECSFEAAVPAQKPRLRNKIDHAVPLPASLKSDLLAALDAMPEGNCICHGDFHPDNVLVSGNDIVIIDWIDASRGNPLADVARTSIIALGVAETARTLGKLQRAFIKIFHSAYLKHYFRPHPQRIQEYYHWLPIMAGARLSENIPELEAWLVAQAQKIK